MEGNPASGSFDALDGAPSTTLGKKLGDARFPLHERADRDSPLNDLGYGFFPSLAGGRSGAPVPILVHPVDIVSLSVDSDSAAKFALS